MSVDLLTEPSPRDGVRANRTRPSGFRANVQAITGAGDEFNGEHPVAQAFLAFVFVAFITGAVLLFDDGQERVRSDTVTAVVVALLLVGGIVAFTTIVRFESVHFKSKRPRSLTIVEAVYLLAQILTTVGYGDVLPVDDAGMALLAFYILCSLLLISDFVSKVVTRMLDRVEVCGEEAENFLLSRDPQEMLFTRPFKFPHPPWSLVVVPGLIAFLLMLLGVLFFHLMESKSWSQSMYWTVITFSTVGFGSILPSTEWGKLFCAFWMLCGVAALLNFVTGVTKISQWFREVERFCLVRAEAQLDANLAVVGLSPSDVADNAPLAVDRWQFALLSLLQAGLVTEAELASINADFDRLGPGGSLCVEQLRAAVLQAVENQGLGAEGDAAVPACSRGVPTEGDAAEPTT